MATVYIDNVEYQLNPQHNLLQGILSQGLDLPYFCWHPALGSVGSCRQCAVTQYADADDNQGKVVMACMTPVADGLHIGLDDAQSSDFRAGIIEALMINHPHDCPVCEEGGECHLQDMTVMTGHTARRYRGTKRTHRNQYLGPFINHEMNRCIACYRCVRFYRDYAGGSDLSAQAAHHHVYFGRDSDGVLESPFSGNLVEVCPTGVFTDKTYSRRYARKWDLQTAPSVCTHCAVGCNTTPAERYERIVRVTNRYHHQLNGYFLCDRGRFGYDYNNAEARIERSYRPAGDARQDVDDDELLADLLARIRDPDHRVHGLGSPRASLEDNFALRALVGEDRFYAGIAPAQWQCLVRHRRLAALSGTGLATVRDIEQADAALVVGEDLANTAPRVELALRQMVDNKGIDYAVSQGVPRWQDAAVRSLGQWHRSPLWQLVSRDNPLGDISERQWFAPPEDIAPMAGAVAHAIDPGAPRPEGLGDEQRVWAEAAARMLLDAERPLLLGGSGPGRGADLDALGNIALALWRRGCEPRLYLSALEANSLGLAALAERDLGELQRRIAEAPPNERHTLVILENDLGRRLSPAAFEALRERTDHWLVLDHLVSPTSERADAVVPVPTPLEKQGTLVNASAIAQRFFAVRHNPDCQPAWYRFSRAVAGVGPDEDWSEMAGWQIGDQVRESLMAALPLFAGIGEAAPGADYRESGLKLRRQSHRYSGRTAMHAHRAVAEGPPPRDEDSPYAFSMEGAWGEGPWRAQAWAPGWNSEQALNKFQQEVGGDWQQSAPLIRLQFPVSAGEHYHRLPDREVPETADTGWRVLPRFEVFGSDELASHSPAVVERAGPVRVWLDAVSARRLGLRDWDSVDVRREGQTHTFHVLIDDSLPVLTLAVPVYRTELMPAMPDQPLWVSIEPAASPLPRPPQLIASDRRGSAHG